MMKRLLTATVDSLKFTAMVVIVASAVFAFISAIHWAFWR